MKILEEASDSLGESGVFEPISLRETFDSLANKKQAQIIRIQNDPKRQQAFLKKIEPIKRMFDKKLKFASSSIDETQNKVLKPAILSPKINEVNTTDPDDKNLKVSPEIY